LSSVALGWTWSRLSRGGRQRRAGFHRKMHKIAHGHTLKWRVLRNGIELMRNFGDDTWFAEDFFKAWPPRRGLLLCPLGNRAA
jgi:hypothetical protein